MPENLVVTIGDMEMEVEAVEGTLVDGELKVSSISTEFLSESFQTLDPEISWVEEEVKDAIRSHWMEQGEWPDTSDANWTEHRLVNEGTQMWQVVKFVEENYPTTTVEIEEELGLNGNTQNVVYKAKQDNLIKTIGRDGNKHLLAPTHLGLKELHVGDALEITGLQSLFDEDTVKDDST